MSHDYVYYTLWFLVTCWLLWDSQTQNRKAQADARASLERIAKYLGDSDQP